MTPLSWRRLALFSISAAALVAAIGFIALAFGGSPLLITPLLALLLLALAGLLLWAGLHVRRYKAGKRTWVTPLHAMRIAVAARASALVSSLVLGALLGILATSLARVTASSMAANALASGLALVAALAWCASALVVERWCLADGEDEDEHPDAQRPSASPA